MKASVRYETTQARVFEQWYVDIEDNEQKLSIKCVDEWSARDLAESLSKNTLLAVEI